MENAYLVRLNREKLKAKLQAGFINFVFLFFFVWGSHYLFQLATYEELGEEAFSQTSLMIQFLLALVGSALWTNYSYSPGRIITEKTNRYLKKDYIPLGKPFYKTSSGLFLTLLFGLLIIIGAQITDVSFRTLFEYQGIQGAKRIFTSIFSPEMSIISMVLAAMVETIFIALLATLIAIPVAFVGSFLSSRNLMNQSGFSLAVYTVCRIVANFTRSVEPLIWAIIFSVWVGIGPFAGMLALMLHSVASLTKLYSEQIESVDRGPIEAIESTGANRIQVIWFGVVPQIILPFVAFTIYRWDINVRMATIIGLVGGGGVGTLLMQYQGLAKWNEVGTIVIVIAIVVWIMDYLSARIREAIY